MIIIAVSLVTNDLCGPKQRKGLEMKRSNKLSVLVQARAKTMRQTFIIIIS
jgi:hypothetical protein